MLKLQESLDKYERYGERPAHSAFLTAALTQTVRDTRTHVDYAGADIKGLSLLIEGAVVTWVQFCVYFLHLLSNITCQL